ncbi:MAG: hypothetical protein SFW62_09660 [Alphaproteobacteria bacterium]|nr:hypothetical protein [Alphaproteobacteria bacterium]
MTESGTVTIIPSLGLETKTLESGTQLPASIVNASGGGLRTLWKVAVRFVVGFFPNTASAPAHVTSVARIHIMFMGVLDGINPTSDDGLVAIYSP